MCPARSPHPGQGNQARGPGRARGRRGAPSHNQPASPNRRNQQNHQNSDTLPLSGPVAVQYNHYVHWIMGGMYQFQLHSSAGYQMGGVFVETSSIVTRTGSTGSYIMGPGPSMEPDTPASEPSEPWPSNSGSYQLGNLGAQFPAEFMPVIDDELGNYTPTQVEHSLLLSGMDAANDGRAGVFQTGVPALTNGGEVKFDRPDLLSSDPTKAYLESLSDEDWLRPIPRRMARVSTFPLLCQDDEDVN